MQRGRSIKARTGCARCKQRRIKCDENGPSCVQCLKRGFRCPGYTRAVKWSTKHELKPSWQHSKDSGASSSQEPSWQWFADQAKTLHAVLQSDLCVPVEHLTSSRKGTSDQVVTSPEDSACAVEDCALPAMAQNIDENALAVPSPRENNAELSLPHLTDECTFLVEYYFSSVCHIISGFDSSTNPLRSWIVTLLPQNPVIQHCVLSISAAHLAQQRETARPLALVHSTNALSCLAAEVAQIRYQDSYCVTDRHDRLMNDSSPVPELLFAIIMLGMTSSWYDSASLGIEHLTGARALFRTHILPRIALASSPNSAGAVYSPDYCFLGRIMAYWEAVGSFIVDQEMDTADYLLPFCRQDGNENEGVGVNPWSGVSTILFLYLSKVGSMARQLHHLRKISASLCNIAEEARRILLQKARHIETLVCQYRIPDSQAPESTGDHFTPVSHFQTLAKAYRLSIFLELYRMFPELALSQAPPSPSLSFFSGHACRLATRHANFTGLAIDILSLIASIPETSGTRAVQTLALIIAGSTLTLRAENTDYANELEDLDPQDRIIFWRSFVRSRLRNLAQYVGLDTVRRARAIVEETWAEGEQRTGRNVYWMDVMCDKGLETLLG